MLQIRGVSLGYFQVRIQPRVMSHVGRHATAGRQATLAGSISATATFLLFFRLSILLPRFCFWRRSGGPFVVSVPVGILACRGTINLLVAGRTGFSRCFLLGPGSVERFAIACFARCTCAIIRRAVLTGAIVAGLIRALPGSFLAAAALITALPAIGVRLLLAVGRPWVAVLLRLGAIGVAILGFIPIIDGLVLRAFY